MQVWCLSFVLLTNDFGQNWISNLGMLWSFVPIWLRLWIKTSLLRQGQHILEPHILVLDELQLPSDGLLLHLLLELPTGIYQGLILAVGSRCITSQFR